MEFSKLMVKFTWKRNSSHRARNVLGRKTVMRVAGLPLRYRAGVILAKRCIRIKSPERQKCRVGGLACFSQGCLLKSVENDNGVVGRIKTMG